MTEDLKSQLDYFKDEPKYLRKVIDELEQENKELKEDNYQLQKDCQICENFIDFIPCKPIRDMDYDLQKVINQRDNYRSALEEIRELVRADCKGCTAECDCDEDCTRYIIKNKINEVIE